MPPPERLESRYMLAVDLDPVLNATNSDDLGPQAVLPGTSEIHGTKWSDDDGDGQRDAGERGLAGVTIYIDEDDDGELDAGEMSVVTRTDDPATAEDEAGRYAFLGIAADSYIVREIVPDGYEQTYPLSQESDFHIEVEFTDNSLTAEQRAVFVTAAARWSEIILGDIPDITLPGLGFVDDLLIRASGPLIDGPGGILGQAGPTHFRTGSFLPAAGIMQFDSADIAELMADGEFDEVILHEMGHVLGIGTIWEDLGLITGVGTNNARFTGSAAVQAYNEIFDITASSVPVESDQGGGGTLYAHWDEATLDNELMTGFLNGGRPNPISRITIGQMADLGYEVNLAAADEYAPLGLRAASDDSRPRLAGRLEVLDLPRTYVEPSAKVELPYLAEPDAGFWSVELAEGEIVREVDFGNRPLPGSLGGLVWSDSNADGVRDASESVLPNWTVYLDEDGNGQFDNSDGEFGSADAPQDIEDFETTISTVDVPVLAGNIVDVNVTLDISHTWDADLRITLVSPSGARVVLADEVGGSGDDFDGTTFDDQASTRITSGAPPFSGRYRPSSPLAVLNGQSAAGEWTLEVADLADLDLGTLNSWSIEIVTGERSTLTNASGLYEFSGLLPDEYSVGLDAPSGWLQTFPADGALHVATLAPGQEIDGLNFGASRGFLGGLVWNDYDADGERDASEPPLAGWQVYLDRNGNGQFDNGPTTVASTDPPAAIPDLSMLASEIEVAGVGAIVDVDVTVHITHSYNSDLDVFLVSPSGVRVELFSDVGAASDNFVNTRLSDEAAIAITSGAAPFTGSFRPEGSLAAFDGLDPNGTWTLELHDDSGSDIGELQGWSLTFTTQEPMTVSDDAGHYGFSDLPPGAYVVGEIVAAGWAQTLPAAPGSHSVDLATGQVRANVNFGNRAASIAGVAWHDLNGDGARDEGEPGLPGWSVYFDSNGNSTFDSGVVTYKSLDAGLAIPDLSTITSQLHVADRLPIEDVDVSFTISHTDVADLDVYLISPTGVRVELFTDLNSGVDFLGTILDDEAPLPILSGSAPFSGSYRAEASLAAFDGADPFGLWTLEVTDDAGNDFGSLVRWSLTISSHELFATTDAEGHYAFFDLPPGSYRVLRTAQVDWQPTAGASGYDIALAAGELRSGVDFGQRQTAPTGDFDRNEIVDGGDFLLWQRSLGAPVSPGDGADGNGDGAVTGDDLTLWAGSYSEDASAAPRVIARAELDADAALDEAFAGLDAASLWGPRAYAAATGTAATVRRASFRPRLPHEALGDSRFAAPPRAAAARGDSQPALPPRGSEPDSDGAQSDGHGERAGLDAAI